MHPVLRAFLPAADSAWRFDAGASVIFPEPVGEGGQTVARTHAPSPDGPSVLCSQTTRPCQPPWPHHTAAPARLGSPSLGTLAVLCPDPPTLPWFCTDPCRWHRPHGKGASPATPPCEQPLGHPTPDQLATPHSSRGEESVAELGVAQGQGPRLRSHVWTRRQACGMTWPRRQEAQPGHCPTGSEGLDQGPLHLLSLLGGSF